jgi:insertion element IS1 protein InsB
MGYHVIPWRNGLKKALTLPALKDSLVEPQQPEAVELELDEMWSFVYSKANKRWLWFAFCKGTSQVVAAVIGGRGEATCKRLWKNIPQNYQKGICYTDFWSAYQSVIPDDQHQAVNKQSGLSNHVERFNNTIRQRLSRFVRKTLSFSKSDQMHLLCLHLFLHRYNLERKAILLK